MNREKVIARNNPRKQELDFLSPFTVGNGRLAYTADATGMQTLYEEQAEAGFPLLTMADWAWHMTPAANGGTYELERDLVMTEYAHQRKGKVRYAVEKQPGNEEVYDWLRENPHRYNLIRIGLYYKNERIRAEQITGIWQSLDLYTGILISNFELCINDELTNGLRTDLQEQRTPESIPVQIRTLCHQEQDVLAFEIRSALCRTGDLQVALQLPYASPDMTGSNWEAEERHETKAWLKDEHTFRLVHTMDESRVGISVCSESVCTLKKGTSEQRIASISDSQNGVLVFEQRGKHSYVCRLTGEECFAFSVGLEPDNTVTKEEGVKYENEELALQMLAGKNDEKELFTVDIPDFAACEQSSICKWKQFWQQGGMISFEHSTDPRAQELERRIILSLYVSAINSCNHMPPQETGLTVNSWYGKSHLEMYLWHLAYLPLWGRSDLLKKSLGWFRQILPKAVKNAKRNDYQGAKWPKMVGPEGVDCPSVIATLLVWQQPHLIYMLELLYQTDGGQEVLREYWDLVRESAEYMADFAEFNPEKQVYELVAPLIPAQESHHPEDTKNPVYEVEYWRFGLLLAIEWAKRLDEPYPAKWQEVAEHMAMPVLQDGVYLAHEQCTTTYAEYAKDHPSMVAALGLLPGERIEPQVMRKTLQKIYETWDFQSMWGWDFAMLAMTETRLGNPAGAVDILLYDTEKNRYMSNGHNLQASRSDLPLYLPGNGSLLLAIPMMAVGYPGCDRARPGFPDDGTWQVEVEGIHPFAY